MPLQLIKHLDNRAARSICFRQILQDVPQYLERCETAFRLFNVFREKILGIAPQQYELKGLVAGNLAAKDHVRVHQERVKEEIRQERMQPDIGKPILKELHGVWLTAKEHADAKKDELTNLAGKANGYYDAAIEALLSIEVAVANFQRSEEEDEDWSGRGTVNGQREGDSKEVLAEVLPLKGKAKKPAKKPLKKGAAKRTRKVKDAPPKPQGGKNEGGEGEG